MANTTTLLPIPQPPKHLFGLLGNLPDIDITAKSTSYSRLVALYGPIFKLDFVAKQVIVLSSRDLVNETFDETRFEKILGTLREVRHAAGDGLITSLTTEPNWKLAHKLLMVPLGPMAIRAMFPKMLDIISQIILKWDRLGSAQSHDATDSFTRLSFDIIALCAFDYRCNSFYNDTVHPFVSSMVGMLEEANRRFSRTNIENKLRMWSRQNFNRDIASMHSIVDEIIANRRKTPLDNDDLLNNMLNARDEETGEGLSDENIRYQVVTLLAAGHETTSGLLSFTMYLLLKNPDKLHKATAEVDAVLGNDVLTIRHLQQLKYVKAVLKESLRLHPPAGQIVLHPKDGGGILGGKYAYTSDDIFIVNLHDMHKDPLVWGTDAAAFKPERMLDEAFETLPVNSWKPWGNGQRECIGRAFAMQESLMTMALILQRFQLEMADPSYSLKISQTITQKPLGFAIKVRRRPGGSYTGALQADEPKSQAFLSKLLGKGSQIILTRRPPMSCVGWDNNTATLSSLSCTRTPTYTPTRRSSLSSTAFPGGILRRAPIEIFYGSNSGTCKSFAKDLQSSLSTFGFTSDKVQILDAATESLPKDRPVVIITASYEGLPSDDGKKFVSWLEAHANDPKALDGVRYTLCGFGNSDWVNTFHRIPKLVDDLMQKEGARRFAPLGLVDVAGDVFGAFEDWYEAMLLALKGSHVNSTGVGPLERPSLIRAESETLELEIHDGWRPLNMGQGEMLLGTVRANRQLAGNEVGFAKKHMEITLPEGMSYSTVLPPNFRVTIFRVLNRFCLPADATVILKNTRKPFLPTNPEYVYALLAYHVELNTPASRKQVAKLAELTTHPEEKLRLKALAGEAFEGKVSANRLSLIDLLEDFPSCNLTFAAYIDMLHPLKPRQYSVSSSPISSSGAKAVTITYDVLKAPALSGNARDYYGVASNYLAQLEAGAKLHCFVRPSPTNFHLPSDSATPIILIAAGTGIAPMRGFIQERAAIAAAGGEAAGKAILYFGCRDPGKDYLYRYELAVWERMGVVEVRPCFSRRPEASGGFRYVPERLWSDRGELRRLFKKGAKIFLCGSKELANFTSETIVRIYVDASGDSVEEAREWLGGLRGERYVSDIFGLEEGGAGVCRMGL